MFTFGLDIRAWGFDVVSLAMFHRHLIKHKYYINGFWLADCLYYSSECSSSIILVWTKPFTSRCFLSSVFVSTNTLVSAVDSCTTPPLIHEDCKEEGPRCTGSQHSPVCRRLSRRQWRGYSVRPWHQHNMLTLKEKTTLSTALRVKYGDELYLYLTEYSWRTVRTTAAVEAGCLFVCYICSLCMLYFASLYAHLLYDSSAKKIRKDSLAETH